MSDATYMEQNKIEQIGRILKDQGLETTSRVNGTDFLTSSELARRLFAQAPSRFLARHSSQELVDIVLACHAGLEKALTTGGVHVEYQVIHEQPSLIVVLGDRPFIVNTVTEHFRARGFAPEVFLHPVLNKGDGWLSLQYVELPDLSGKERDDLVLGLRSALNDLIAVTDDYTPMLARTESIARYLESSTANAVNPLEENVEYSAFLRWLMNGAFTFMGITEHPVEGTPGTSGALGLFRTSAEPLLKELALDWDSLLSSGATLSVSKLKRESTVHHLQRLLHIAVVEASPDKKTKTIHSIVGILTSKALAEESSGAPLIRRKLRSIITAEEILENTHDCKKVAGIIDHMPKAEALILDLDILRRLARAAISTESLASAEVILNLDPHGRGLTTIVLLPPDRFNQELGESLARIIERAVQAPENSCDVHVDVTAPSETRLYFSAISGLPHGAKPDLDGLRKELLDASASWSERIGALLSSSLSTDEAEEICLRFADGFSDSYCTTHSPATAVEDILYLCSLHGERDLRVSLKESADPLTSEMTHFVTLYGRSKPFTISDVAPKLENFGMEVVSESSWQVRSTEPHTYVIQRFGVRLKHTLAIDQATFESLVEPFIVAVLRGRSPSDPLNGLVLTTQLSQRQVELLRTYCYLLWQVNTSATRRTLVVTLAATPDFARRLWQMFDTKFNPLLHLDVSQRLNKFHEQLAAFKHELLTVREIARDRIYRALATLIEHTVRTNFFISDDAIALKLHSEKIDLLPNPRPKFEMFVMSPTVEAVHLRGGAVARGGIRWSDRHDDYRTEVLGLMKTQKIKNVVIVPTGAKGGFIVKQPPADPTQMPTAVIEAYKEFLRAILSITDNRAAGGVVPPQGVIRFDPDDPYLVVAADKGTATFSDTANTIATNEFSFWLGDAFASGGSNGYDHKLYGITARGAWECVKRHFNDIGLDYDSHPFTVVGIGDMSGDVFGNGLVMSPQMRLLAAFNHRHIFIDPSPDAAAAFKERMRLFETRGQWSDYDKQLISEGGGVFDRFEKEISITPQMRSALKLSADFPATVTGEQLISAVLRAEVDLLWNGGIGTYVKASYESHQQASDATNDGVRVSADELRCRVVAEGGNLGFTQRARIEFAERGGRINTDAIDNSGGVDLSDHEVNLKILFAGLLRDGKIALDERNRILKEMAAEVCEMVLQHNRRHALMLSFAEDRSKRNIDYVRSLIQQLSKLGFVNRSLDALPDDEEIIERAEQGRGLTRPELAVCTAATKMWINDALLNSSLHREPVLQPYLLGYFPAILQRRFKAEILLHPLGREVIATQLTSSLVDFLGVTYFHRTASNFNVPVIQVLKCAIAAFELLRAEHLFGALQKLDTPKSSKTFLQASKVLFDGCRAVSTWLLSMHRDAASVESVLLPYQTSFESLLAGPRYSGSETQTTLEQSLLVEGLSQNDAVRLAMLPGVVPVLEVVRLARITGKDSADVGSVYHKVAELLAVGAIHKAAATLPASGKWEQDLLSDALSDIQSSVSSTALMLLQRGITSTVEVESKLRSSDAFVQLRSAIDDLNGKIPSVAAVAVLGRKLREMQL